MSLLSPFLENSSEQLVAKIFKKIEEVPQEKWESVFPDVLENYSFFKSLDESNFEQFSSYYITVCHGEEMIAAAPCFYMNYPLETTVQGWLKTAMTWVRGIFPGLFNLSAVICGVSIGQGRIGFQREEKTEAMEAILKAMNQIAAEKKASIIAFKDFASPYLEVLDPIQKSKFYKFQSLPTTIMDVSFRHFEEYIKTLSGATRYDLRRKFKRNETSGVRIDFEVTQTLGDNLDVAYDLFSQTVARSGIQFEKVPKDFFVKIAENMPGRIRYFLWKIDQKLVAFMLGLVSEDYLIDFYVGLDYSLAYQYNLYFVKFRDVMNWCFVQGIKKYEMGNTTYEPKIRLGFDLVPLYVYAKHRNPWKNPFLKLLCKLLKPENFDPMFQTMKN